MRRIEQVRPAGIEHRPPARRRRLHAQAEEAQRRLGDDRARHAERGLHDDRRERRRQDVAQDDARRARAEARAACTNSNSRARSTWPRTSRA